MPKNRPASRLLYSIKRFTSVLGARQTKRDTQFRSEPLCVGHHGFYVDGYGDKRHGHISVNWIVHTSQGENSIVKNKRKAPDQFFNSKLIPTINRLPTATHQTHLDNKNTKKSVQETGQDHHKTLLRYTVKKTVPNDHHLTASFTSNSGTSLTIALSQLTFRLPLVVLKMLISVYSSHGHRL